MKSRYCWASAKHRDPGEIDLLRAGKREQEIERSLEALDVDDESLAGARRLAVVFRLLPVGDVIALFRRVVVGVFSRVHVSPPLFQLTRRFRS